MVSYNKKQRDLEAVYLDHKDSLDNLTSVAEISVNVSENDFDDRKDRGFVFAKSGVW